MSISHNLTYAWAQGSNSLSKTKSSTGGAEANISESISANQTDLLIAYVLDVSQLKSIFMLATADMTLETNSSSVPGTTIALKANEPYMWHSNSPQANPFGATDVTALYVTNTTAGDLDIRALVDPTV